MLYKAMAHMSHRHHFATPMRCGSGCTGVPLMPFRWVIGMSEWAPAAIRRPPRMQAGAGLAATLESACVLDAPVPASSLHVAVAVFVSLSLHA